MKAPKITPGKWAWDGYYLQREADIATGHFDPVWDDGSAGGEYSGYDTHSPDGVLIAAAPQLATALNVLYEATAEYIRLNCLGDVHHNPSMKAAREALLAAGYTEET